MSTNMSVHSRMADAVSRWVMPLPRSIDMADGGTQAAGLDLDLVDIESQVVSARSDPSRTGTERHASALRADSSSAVDV